METLQSFEKKFLILQEISSMIAATKDITSLAYTILDRAIDYTNAEKGSLMLKNEMNELYILAARGFDPLFIRNYKIRIGEGIAGIIAQDHDAVLVKDIEKDERFRRAKRDRYKTKSFISCSIVSGQSLLGVININDKTDGMDFTEDELRLLKAIAYQAAIAFENAFLISQLRKKAAELEDINRSLIETDMDKTEFITRISHELRSPLNSIKGSVYFLLHSERLHRNTIDEFCNIILDETNGLVSIVENLIDFLRLENEAMVMKKSLINLPGLLDDIAKSKGLNIILKEKNIDFRLNVDRHIQDITGDKIKISSLFINLLEGVSHYLENGDSIEMSVSDATVLHISLSASRNISEDVIANLSKSKYFFYKEWSFDEMRLYIAKKSAEAHGWTFEAKNSADNFLVVIRIPKSMQETVETTVNMIMDLFADFVSELLSINICSIMLKDELTSDLTIRGAKGLDDEIVRRTRINVGEQIAGWVAAEGKPLLVEDVEKLDLKRRHIPQYNTKSLLSLPLKINDKVIGILNLNNKKTSEVFDKKDLYIGQIIAERISGLLAKLYSGDYNPDELNRMIASFGNLVDVTKRYYKKEKLLSDLVYGIMEKLGASETEKQKAMYISMVYDLGLVSMDDSLLAKRELMSSDLQSLRQHPSMTVELLDTFEGSEEMRKAILHHHERYDGAGYPSGLRGAEIPLISRVIAVVDSYRAMISEKPYRRSFSPEEALQDIKTGAGSRYDPAIVRAFEEVLKEEFL